MRIRMLVHKTGRRHDGQDWPDRGGELDVGADEGVALCDQGDAIPVVTDDAEEPAPDTADVEIRGMVTLTPAAVPEPDDGGFLPDEAAADEPVEPDEPPALAAKPIVNSPKAAWVDYAVSLGGERAGAEASTKADLINWVKDKEG